MTENFVPTAGAVHSSGTPYQHWARNEGIPNYVGGYQPDLHTIEVAPWPRMGQKGAFVNLDPHAEDDAYVLEIAPGGETEVIHHCFEAMILVLHGRGATTFWQPGTKKQTVEWQRGSLFAPPLNCYYQHFNLDGQAGARLFAVTAAPMMINLVRNPEFAFNNPFVFWERYSGEDNYFTDPGRALPGNVWQTNFIPDLRMAHLVENDSSHRGAPQRIMHYALSNNSMVAHCSDFPIGQYKKAHCHGGGAHIVILEGSGYSYLNFEGEAPRRYDWKGGTLLSPQEAEYHQHFNTGPVLARDAALRMGQLGTSGRKWSTWENIRGVPYEEQDPAIYKTYVDECTRNGIEVRMPQPAVSG